MKKEFNKKPDLYDKCQATIQNNDFEDDEIKKSGLTVEESKTVDAPRISECFLNIECDFLWEKDHFKGSNDVVVCLKMKHIAMDEDYYDENKKGRYGKTGYIYNIHSPRNPETGEIFTTDLGILKNYAEWAFSTNLNWSVNILDFRNNLD